MTTLSVFADTPSGHIGYNSTSRANLDAGTGGADVNTSSNTYTIGTWGTGSSWNAYTAYLEFDTSALTSGATVSAAEIDLYTFSKPSTAFTIDVLNYDWGTSLTSGDYRNAAALAALTVRGTLSTASLSTSAYVAITLSGVTTIVNKTGYTRLLLADDKYVTSAAVPTSSAGGDLEVYNEDNTGTSKDPYILVTYTVATAYTLAATAVTGTSTVTPTSRLDAKATAAVAGTSTVTPSPHMQGYIAHTAFTCNGTVSPTARLGCKITAAAAGTSTVTPTPHMQGHATAAAVGASTVTPTPHMQGLAAAVVVGAGQVSPTPYMQGYAAAALHGLPSVVSTARLDSKIVGSVNGATAVGTPTPLSRGQFVVASPTGASTIGAAAWMCALVQSNVLGQSTVFGSQHLKALAQAALAGASTVASAIHLGTFIVSAVHGVPTINGRALLYGTVTVYATSDYIFLNSTSQANLEAGSGSQSSGGNTILDVGAGGQFSSWSAYESLLSFDTSGLPLHSVLQSAVVHLYGTTLPTTDFFLKSYWVTSSGWKTKAQLAALTAASSTYTAGVGTGYNAITLDVSHSGITQGSTAKIVLASGDYVAGSGYPTSAKILSFSSERQSGTSQDPYIVFTWVIGDDLSLDATALHGTPTVTPTIHMAGRAASAVTGAGAVVGSPHMQANLATLTVTGAAVLATTGRRGQEFSSSVTGASSVIAAARRGQDVAASPAGTSSLSAGIHMAALVHAALLQHGQVGTAAFIATLLMSATDVRGAGIVAGAPHMQAHPSAAVQAHGLLGASPHSQTVLAATSISAHATISAHLLAIAIAAHIAAHGSISANAIRKLYIQAVIDGASIIQTGSVFDEEGQRAAMRGHGWTVADGTPWYERLVRQGGV